MRWPETALNPSGSTEDSGETERIQVLSSTDGWAIQAEDGVPTAHDGDVVGEVARFG